MATPKYKDYFNQMFELHRQEFTEFMLLCNQYMSDRATHSEEFNRQGKEIKAIMIDWETKLCGRMERGKNSTYSANLSDKFWDEIRKYFPCIDEVGIKVTKL